MTSFQEFLEDNDFRTRSYSGRGMFGTECLAVSVDDICSAVWKMGEAFGCANASSDKEDHIEGPKGRVCTAQLGRGYVIYWPSVPFVGDDSWDDDEEEEEDNG